MVVIIFKSADLAVFERDVQLLVPAWMSILGSGQECVKLLVYPINPRYCRGVYAGRGVVRTLSPMS